MKHIAMGYVVNPDLEVSSLSELHFLIRDRSNGKFWKVSASVISALKPFGLQLAVSPDFSVAADLSVFSGPNPKLIKAFCQRGWIFDPNEPIKPSEKRHSPSYITLPFVMLPSNVVNRLGKYLKVLFNRKLFALLFFLGVLLLVTAILKHRALELHSAYLWPFIFFMFLSVFFHELGHTSALIHGGEKAGPIGGGFYLFTPVMFADVTNAWALKLRERQRVNIGGIYFEMIFFAVFYLLFEIAAFPEYQNIIVLIGLKSLWNLNPLLRSDGYWILSDALKVPNLYEKSFIEWKQLFGRKKSHVSPVLLIYGALSGLTVGLSIYYTFRLSITRIKTWPYDLFTGIDKFFSGQEVKVNLTELIALFPVLIFCYLFGKLLRYGFQKVQKRCLFTAD